MADERLGLVDERGTLQVIGVAVAHHAAIAIGHDALETHIVGLGRNGVGVQHAGVPEHRGTLPEELLNQVAVLLHLLGKLTRGIQGGQGGIVRHGQELHAAGLSQFLEGGDEVRAVVAGLLQNHAGDSEGKLELAVGQLDELLHHAVGGQVAALCHSAQHASVHVVILIEGVFANLEEIVRNQAVRLMRMKCEGDIHLS